MRGGLIVVRAGEGMWAEAYDNLDFLVLLHQGKRTKKKQGKVMRRLPENGKCMKERWFSA